MSNNSQALSKRCQDLHINKRFPYSYVKGLYLATRRSLIYMQISAALKTDLMTIADHSANTDVKYEEIFSFFYLQKLIL